MHHHWRPQRHGRGGVVRGTADFSDEHCKLRGHHAGHRSEYSDEVVSETEALAVEVEAVDFPEVDADRKDGRLFAMLWLKKC